MQLPLAIGSLVAAASFASAASSASPPACLLAALGAQDNPADTKALCQDLQDTVLEGLTQKCGDDDTTLADAYEQFASVCSDIGIKVSKLPTDEAVDDASKKGKGKGGSGGEETETATGTAASATSTSDDDDDSAAFSHGPSIFYLMSGLGAATLAGAMLL